MTSSELDLITEKIIGCAFRVGSRLGHGFLEKVYENALSHECRKAGLIVEQQKSISVFYDGILVGEYFADLLVNESVIVELKAVKSFEDYQLAQCLNYLKATGQKVCLLLNFGTSKVEVKRIVRGF